MVSMSSIQDINSEEESKKIQCPNCNVTNLTRLFYEKLQFAFIDSILTIK